MRSRHFSDLSAFLEFMHHGYIYALALRLTHIYKCICNAKAAKPRSIRTTTLSPKLSSRSHPHRRLPARNLEAGPSIWAQYSSAAMAETT